MILLQDLLLEIGDSSPYKFTFKDIDPNGISMFYFTTKSGLKYELTISVEDINGQPIAIANFDVLPENPEDYKSGDEEHKLTNRFETLSVMATVQEAMKMILKKNKSIKILQFSAKQEGEGDERRKNIYLAYIKRAYPGAEVTQNGKDTTVKLK